MSNVTAVPLAATKRSYLIWLWIAIAIAVVGAFFLSRQGDAALFREARGSTVVETPSGLRYKILEPGKGGTRPTDADVTLVNYEGRLLDGTTFDKSQRPTPMPVSSVVPGFSEALKLMPKGAKYRFWLPPALGYGDKGTGPIPGNATLVFDVELLDFLPEMVVRQMQSQMQPGGGSSSPSPPLAGVR